jgi:hypothetical protein
MKVLGIEGLTLRELIDRVKDGSRFVVFDWCVGLGVKSLRLPSAVYFVEPGEPTVRRAAWRCLASLLTGWWSLIPLGPIETIDCLRENLCGGRDITAGVLRTLARAERHALEGRLHDDQSRDGSVGRPVTSNAA